MQGIREAPSKAIMNELARDSGDAPDAAYGLRQSLGTAGLSVVNSSSTTFARTEFTSILCPRRVNQCPSMPLQARARAWGQGLLAGRNACRCACLVLRSALLCFLMHALSVYLRRLLGSCTHYRMCLCTPYVHTLCACALSGGAAGCAQVRAVRAYAHPIQGRPPQVCSVRLQCWPSMATASSQLYAASG